MTVLPALPDASPSHDPVIAPYTATTFRALGTYAYLAVRDPRELDAARTLAQEILRDVDETCSRFRDDSDLSRVNAHPGHWVEVDPLLIEAARVAVSAARQTDGLVNPLLGAPLIYLGYDRDFETLQEVAPAAHDATEQPVDRDAWQLLELADGAIRIPPATALDLGATAKAWAADLIARAFGEELSAGSLVSLGGDLAIARGASGAAAEPWPIGVSEHPGAAPDQVVTLAEGGLATSSTLVRSWTRHGIRRHHLIDPRNGMPAQSPWRTITATGPSAAAANIASTASIVLGEAAVDWLTAREVSARLVAHDATVHVVGGWPAPAASAEAGRPPHPDGRSTE